MRNTVKKAVWKSVGQEQWRVSKKKATCAVMMGTRILFVLLSSVTGRNRIKHSHTIVLYIFYTDQIWEHIYLYTDCRNEVITPSTSAAMKAEEGKDAAPCQVTPAGKTAWDTLLQQLGANYTCARMGFTLSRAHRGHLRTLLATPVLLTHSPLNIRPCGKPPDGAT